MRPIVNLTGTLVLAAAMGGVLLQHNALSTARTENQRLRNEQVEAARLAQENGEIERLRAENQELAKLRKEVTELHKLRNETRQLRGQTEALPSLQAENRRLKASAASPTDPPRPALDSQPPITIEQAAFAGMATPEATLQSFLWAIRQEDIQAYRTCLTPEQQKEMESRGEEQIRTNMRGAKGHLKGFRIAAKKQVSAEEIQLGVQAYGGDEEQLMALPFKRIGNEWKLDLNP